MNGRIERDEYYRPVKAMSFHEIRRIWRWNVFCYRVGELLPGLAAAGILGAVTVIGANIIRAGLHYDKWSWMVR